MFPPPYNTPVNEPNAFGTYPIQFAMAQDDPDMVKLVIEAGADPNIDLGEGWTPLHEAFDYAIDGMIQHNRTTPSPEALEVIKILIDNGANMHLKNGKGNTPLDSINTYAGSIKGFNRLMQIFRPIIPSIDQLIVYKSKR